MTAAPAAAGASNGEPSRRATTASVTSALVRTLGGEAGRSTCRAAWPTIASTARSIMPSTTDRGSAPPRAITAPGICDVSCLTSDSSRAAGAQATARSTIRAPGRLALRRVGTIRPCATVSTAASDTRPTHLRLGPMSSCPWATVTSHPRASARSIDREAARDPSGNGTDRCGAHPCGGASTDSRRSESWSPSAGAVPRPADHTTRRPASHVACSCASPGSASPGGAPSPVAAAIAVVGGLLSRSSAPRSCVRIAVNVATPRASLPDRPSQSCSSIPATRRSSETRHPTGSASSSAACCGVAIP